MTTFIGGALLLGLAYLLSALAVRYFGWSTSKGAAFGIFGGIVLFFAGIFGHAIYEDNKLKARVEAEKTKQQNWLRELCDERRKKNEVPGAGC